MSLDSLKDKESDEDKTKVNTIFTCPQCSYTSRKKVNLTRHLKTKHLEPDRKFKCPECSYTTWKKFNLSRHIQTNHQVLLKKSFVCEKSDCRYATRWKCDLLSHLLHRHTEDDQITWFQCQNCEFKAKTRVDLRRHMTFKHLPDEEIKWYECEKCCYKSKAADNLKRHLKTMHDEAKKMRQKRKQKINNLEKTVESDNASVQIKDEIIVERMKVEEEEYDVTPDGLICLKTLQM